MRRVTLVFTAICFSFQLSAQSIEHKMDDLMNGYVGQHKFNGSVLVAQKGKVLYQNGFGYRNAEEKIVNDANSIFQIGSITKQFTSAIIMQLHQENKLQLDDKLDQYIPGFPNGEKITIEHLLTHTSGIHNYTEDSAIMHNDVSKSYSQQELLKIFKAYQPDFDPGTKWNYSNTGYSLLGYILEKIEKKPYEKVARERIIHPLGMNKTGFNFAQLDHPDKTKGYFTLQPGIVRAPIVDSTLSYAAGALYSTVGDLHKWERAIYTDKILKPESWKEIFTPYKNKYGYGWSIDSLYKKQITSHTGSIHGYTSYILRFPGEELSVVVIDNASSRSPVEIAEALAAIVLGEAYEIPKEKQAIILDESVLKQYVGEYQLAPSFIITIKLENGKLLAEATGQPAVEIFAEKENFFFLKVVEARIEFVKDEKGNVTDLILYQNGQQPRGKKIK